ncbi:MAG TPA: histidine phosphatase family protein [Tepidisphaeraceae bacterium]|nr:histidine phosphatase family protein [Tepidisphaeraceae bacterium]
MNGFRNLILIKHARPAIDPAKPPEQWPLGDEGRAAAAAMVDRLAAFKITQIFHSDEVKAIETAEILAARLDAPLSFRADVHEHDRSNVPHMRSGEFISHVELFFRKPDELVLGKETATGCLARYQAAIDGIIAEQHTGDVAVVTHGTALALYLAQLGTGKPFDIWRRMGLPSFAVIDLHSMTCTQMVDRINPE